MTAPTPTNLTHFADNHHCETVRGMKKPSAWRALNAIAERCAWMEKRIAANAAAGQPDKSRGLLRELAATLMLIEGAFSKVDAETRALVERLLASHRNHNPKMVAEPPANEG